MTGKGLPDDFDKAGDESSPGLELIHTLTERLEDKYSYISLEQGVQFELVSGKTGGRGVGSNP